MKLSCVVCGVAVFLAVGCNKQSGLDTNTLVGQFSVRYPHGSETLQLGDDGKFTQIYIKAENGQSMTNSGTWELDKEFNKLFLNGAVLFDTRSGQRSDNLERTVWGLPIVRRFGEISLQIDAEGVLEYRRLQPKSPSRNYTR
jgi:hypothetical protein